MAFSLFGGHKVTLFADLQPCQKRIVQKCRLIVIAFVNALAQKDTYKYRQAYSNPGK